MPPVRLRRSVAGSARPAPPPETQGTVRYLSAEEIGDALGVTYETIRQWRHRFPSFPAPDGQIGGGGQRSPAGWLPGRLPEIRAWRDAMPGTGANKRVMSGAEKEQARAEWAQRDVTGVTQAALAKKYGVDATTMSRIVRPEAAERERRTARTRAGGKRSDDAAPRAYGSGGLFCVQAAGPSMPLSAGKRGMPAFTGASACTLRQRGGRARGSCTPPSPRPPPGPRASHSHPGRRAPGDRGAPTCAPCPSSRRQARPPPAW